MSLNYHKSLHGADQTLISVILDQSEVVNAGDVVQVRNGNVELANGQTEAVAGIVVDIVDGTGLSLTPEVGSIANLGSATRASDGTITVASDNETVDLIAAKIDVSKLTIWSSSQDGTMNTTNASNKLGGWIDLVAAGDSMDESTHTRTIGTAGVFKTWGVDPDDSTRILVSINESEIFDPGTGSALT